MLPEAAPSFGPIQAHKFCPRVELPSTRIEPRGAPWDSIVVPERGEGSIVGSILQARGCNQPCPAELILQDCVPAPRLDISVVADKRRTWPSLSLSLSLSLYIYICVHTIFIYIYVFVYVAYTFAHASDATQ